MEYMDHRYGRKIEKAMGALERVLETTKNPQLPEDVAHEYGDKYLAAELLTNTALAATLNVLEAMGLSAESLQTLLKWKDLNTAVSLRFESTELCKYAREEVSKEEGPEYVTEKKGMVSTSKTTSKVVTKVSEYIYTFDHQWEAFAYEGSDPSNKVPLNKNSSSAEVKTKIMDNNPRGSEAPRMYSRDVNITFLLQNLGPHRELKFTIDRNQDTCRTPRQNERVIAAAKFFKMLGAWSANITRKLQSLADSQCWSPDQHEPFVPILPFFMKSESSGPQSQTETPSSSLALAFIPRAFSTDSAVLPSLADVNLYLQEQKRSMEEICTKLLNPPGGSPSRRHGYVLCEPDYAYGTLIAHLGSCCDMYNESVQYLEELLRQQMIAALGKEVGPAEFADYMQFHYRKVFVPEYSPQPFCYAIRRPDHYPEGTLSIEAASLKDGMQPINTLVRCREAQGNMMFSINAATQVAFTGKQYLHGYMATRFSDEYPAPLSLCARARQFSSFILLVGRIASATLFEPTCGIILQNKDELVIPLELESIPTAKAFKKATQSMSDEMQRFAKAFRAMQLESTLFGMVVIQIKPAMEQLLRLPTDSLTKEIRLTQDLMELFLKYQVPSDLLTAVGDGNTVPTPKEAVEEVQGHVKNMHEMIKDAKEKEIEEEKMRKKMEEEERTKRATVIHYEMAEPLMELTATPMMMACRSAAVECEMVADDCYEAYPDMDYGAAPNYEDFEEQGDEEGGEGEEQEGEEQEGEEQEPRADGGDAAAGSAVIDYTKVPSQMDKQLEELDEDGAVRPTIINVMDTWTKRSQKGLLSDMKSETLYNDQQDTERNRAFDLLDALSRSGTLSLEADLHIVVGATHCFDKTLMNTVIQGNVNPIEKVEKSALIVASTIQDATPSIMIKDSELARVKDYSPNLFQDRMLE